MLFRRGALWLFSILDNRVRSLFGMDQRVSVHPFCFLFNDIRGIFFYHVGNDSNFLQVCQGFMNVFENFKCVGVVIARTVVLRCSVFICARDNGGSNEKGAYTSLTKDAIGSGKVVTLVLRGTRGLFVLVAVVCYRFAVRLLCSAISNVALSFSLLCTLWRLFRIAYYGKGMGSVRTFLGLQVIVAFFKDAGVSGNFCSCVS